MSTSTIPFISSGPSSAAPQPTLVHHHRRRSRTISLLSVKSGTSEKLSLESPKSQATVVACDSFENHLACGSFVLNTPAATVLRTFFPTMHPHAYQRSHSTSLEQEWEVQPSSSSSHTPFITRTTPPSSGSPSTFPVRARMLPRARNRSRSRPRPRPRPRIRAYSEVHPHDLHSVLAGFEQQSKFCEKKSVCSTCNREGIAFPQCGKCGKSWCCRECRLKGSMKHSCTMKSA